MQPYRQYHLPRPHDHLQDFKELEEDAKDARDAKDKGEETTSGLQHLAGNLHHVKGKPLNKEGRQRAGTSRHIVSTTTTGTCVSRVDLISQDGTPARLALPSVAAPVIKKGVTDRIISSTRHRDTQ